MTSFELQPKEKATKTTTAAKTSFTNYGTQGIQISTTDGDTVPYQLASREPIVFPAGITVYLENDTNFVSKINVLEA